MALRFKQESRNITDLVDWYETNFLRAANRVRAMTPEQLATPVDFAGVFKMPAVFYPGFVNNHSVHHRGQLAAYLWPMGAKVPSIYGRSADEPWNGRREAAVFLSRVCELPHAAFLFYTPARAQELASLQMRTA
jgi:hypothetical protein